jgi:hypothetical protein
VFDSHINVCELPCQDRYGMNFNDCKTVTVAMVGQELASHGRP